MNALKQHYNDGIVSSPRFGVDELVEYSAICDKCADDRVQGRILERGYDSKEQVVYLIQFDADAPDWFLGSQLRPA